MTAQSSEPQKVAIVTGANERYARNYRTTVGHEFDVSVPFSVASDSP
jgi:hypothetical protein